MYIGYTYKPNFCRSMISSYSSTLKDPLHPARDTVKYIVLRSRLVNLLISWPSRVSECLSSGWTPLVKGLVSYERLEDPPPP